MRATIPVQGNVNADVSADATPLVQATADVVSSSNKGLGKLLKALFGKWIAKNERAVALIQAQTEKDCAEVRNGIKVYREGQLLDCPAPVTVLDAYNALHTLNHMSDARRLQAAMEEAIRQISTVPFEEISDEPISQTFFNRWRREAEMIDDNELRQWWAGLLKEEVVQPNRISMRTLDVVKNLSKNDCMCFANLCRGAISGELIVSYDNRPIFGSYDDIVRFQELGLMSNLQSAAKMNPLEGSEELTIRLSDGVSRLRITGGVLWVHTFSLTSAGFDLIRVIGGCVITEDDVKTIYKFLSKHQIESSTITIVNTIGADHSNNWVWARGHRPACYE